MEYCTQCILKEERTVTQSKLYFENSSKRPKNNNKYDKSLIIFKLSGSYLFAYV